MATRKRDIPNTATASATASLETVARIAESFPLGMLAVDAGGAIVLANSAAARLLGYEPHELVGVPVEALVPDGRRAAHAGQRMDYMRQPVTRPMGRGRDMTARRKDGSLIPVEIGLAPIGLDGGPCVLASIVDLTRRRHAEEALRRARDELEMRVRERTRELEAANRTLNEAQRVAHVGNWDWHVGADVVSWSDEVYRIFGLEPQESGATLEAFLASVHPAERDAVSSVMTQALANGVCHAVDHRIVLPDGAERAVHQEMEVTRDAEGRPVHLLGTVQDVTTRVQAEDALRRSEAAYRGLIERAPYGIFEATPDGRLLSANQALTTMLGYDGVEDVLRADQDDALYASPDERKDLARRLSRTRDVEDVEMRWRRKDGQAITVRLRGRALYDERGGFDRFEVFAENVTERRALEMQLRQAQKMEAIGQLTGGVAHDFNNLLTVILAHAELVWAALPPELEEQRADIKVMQAAALRGATMVRQLMAFSRENTLVTQEVALNALVHDVGTMLARLLPEHIRVRMTADCPVTFVRADPGAVEQMLLNLGTNARDAMPEGGTLTIAVRRERVEDGQQVTYPWVAAGEYACVEVADTGTGMDAATRERVFEPFFTTKARGEGTGLGMAMIYGLMKQHHGFVQVDSEVGRGTTVRLFFPLAQGRGARLAPRDAGAGVAGGSETILVVEDEAGIRRVAQRALESRGYHVLVAADGREALAVFEAHPDPIHLVLTDLVMPGLGGRQLVDALRERGKRPRVLYMSGYSRWDLGEGSAVDERVPLLHKPWSFEDLAAKVRQVLDGPAEP